MNHQIKRAFMAMLLSVFCFVGFAQNDVTGIVKDGTGEPLRQWIQERQPACHQ